MQYGSMIYSGMIIVIGAELFHTDILHMTLHGKRLTQKYFVNSVVTIMKSNS